MASDFQIGIGEHRAPPGTHICHLGTPSSGPRIAVDLVATGLGRGERCLLVGDDSFAQPVLRRLRSRKIDVDAALKQRSLIRLHGQETGVELFASIVSHLENPSPAGARLVGSPRWNKRGWPSLGDLLAFETLLEQVASSYHALFFCFFDRQAAPSEAMDLHPKTIVGKEIVENSRYLAPTEMRHHLRLTFSSK